MFNRQILLSCITILIIAIPANSFYDRTFTTAQWLEDLDFVVSGLKSHHPHLYYRISEEEFDTVVAQSREEIKQAQSDLECFFAIRKTVACIQDGHTQLSDNGKFSIVDLRFPFRLDKFTDGIFITVISKDYEQYLGSQVTAINGKPISNVYGLLEKTANMDNKYGRIRPTLSGVTFARTMYGLGITDSVESIELELITPDGEFAKLNIESIEDTSRIDWSTRLNIGPTSGEYVHSESLLGDETPLHLKKQGRNVEFYWFEHLAKDKYIYFQFNQVADQPGTDETFVQFTDRIWSYIDEHANEVDKLIIDIRYNDGGNGRMVMPFLNQIIKRDNINNRDSLFVLVGYRTYSAAVIFTTELAVHTNAVFIGDPPGCPFNFFSDTIFVGNLPNSGFALYVASRQIDNAWSPHSVYFPPDIPAPFSSKDYFTGKDPALELALHGDLTTLWEFTAKEGAEAGLKYYYQLKEKYSHLDWWPGLNHEILENQINQHGYVLLREQNLESALRVFKLNTMLFPDSFNVWDSLAECFYNMKKYELSLKYYKKSVEINPDNDNGKQMIERIMKEKKIYMFNKY